MLSRKKVSRDFFAVSHQHVSAVILRVWFPFWALSCFKFVSVLAYVCLTKIFILAGVVAKIHQKCENLTDRFDKFGCPVVDLRARQIEDDDDNFSEIYDEFISDAVSIILNPITASVPDSDEEVDEEVSDLLDLFTVPATQPSTTTAAFSDLVDDFEDIAASFSTLINGVLSDFDVSGIIASPTGFFESLTEANFESATEPLFFTPESSGSTFDFDDDNDDDDGDNTNVGAIVGGVVGGLAFIAALLGFLFLYRRRRKRARMTVTNTSEAKPTSDLAQSYMVEDKIVGVPDNPGSPQLQRKPVQNVPAGPISADTPVHSHIPQLHGISQPSLGVGPFPAVIPAQQNVAPFHNDPTAAQLHGDAVQMSGAGYSSVAAPPSYSVRQYYGGPASGPNMGELPTDSAYPTPVAQLHGEPAHGFGPQHDTTNHTELAGSSSVSHR